MSSEESGVGGGIVNIHRPQHHWGHHLWAYIHTLCVIDFENNATFVESTMDHLKKLLHAIPCKYCKEEFAMFLERLHMYDTYKSMELFRWSVDFHNHVNRHLGKPEMPYVDAVKLWAKRIQG
jgi:hypothetical protein